MGSRRHHSNHPSVRPNAPSPAVSSAMTINSIMGTDTGSTAYINSGGLTKDNTLELTGSVSDGVTSVEVYDGKTLLGTATITEPPAEGLPRQLEFHNGRAS